MRLRYDGRPANVAVHRVSLVCLMSPKFLCTAISGLLTLALSVFLSCELSAQPVPPDQPVPPWPVLKPSRDRQPLPGTQPLLGEHDFADVILDGVDQFLQQKIDQSKRNRPRPDSQSSGDRRTRFGNQLGLHRDQWVDNGQFSRLGGIAAAPTEIIGVRLTKVSWSAFAGVQGFGLLLQPAKTPVANVILIPDADQDPLEFVVAAGNEPSNGGPAWALANAGCRVLIPLLVDRSINRYRLTEREWLHRPAWELGRTLTTYEMHQVRAAIGCLQRLPATGSGKCLLGGWGEGGRLAMYVGAVDQRVAGTLISGYFGPRDSLWTEPAERSVFGLLNEFGDAEIVSLLGNRGAFIEHCPGPTFGYRLDEDGEIQILTTPAGLPGKPGKLPQFDAQAVNDEAQRIANRDAIELIHRPSPLSSETLQAWLNLSGVAATIDPNAVVNASDQTLRQSLQLRPYQERLVEQLRRHNQWALNDSRRIRQARMKALDTSSIDAYADACEPLRREFAEQVIGQFDDKLLPANARSRKYQEGPLTVSYEVTLDVFPGVIAYGILTLPKDLSMEGTEKRPVIVCQHGLEGRPQDVIGESKFKAYAAFATRLAERGFVTFAPQNFYIKQDRFRLMQFKSNSIGRTLFSVIVPQHRQITDWLAELPFVDNQKIAFYGLSYGGKSAMRIPPLVPRYCLSICSADFNEWIWKNAATDPASLRYSYANKGEYEIFEFNLGNTFNYAEMAALIAPRPFMVERGHFDGVAPDETVAYEFAKVRNLYQARLGLEDRCEIEWFVGPHQINGVQTFEFLEKHLGIAKP